jgi:hypothetical protein
MPSQGFCLLIHDGAITPSFVFDWNIVFISARLVCVGYFGILAICVNKLAFSFSSQNK